MKIGKYTLGRYHAIIEKRMEDGSFQYETNFSSKADLEESVKAILHLVCGGEKVGLCTDKPMRIMKMRVYRGKEAVEKLKDLAGEGRGHLDRQVGGMERENDGGAE